MVFGHHNKQGDVEVGNPHPTATHASHSTIPGGNDNQGIIGDNTTAPPTRIFLKPIAHPTALGLAAYGSASFVFAAYLAEWYGKDTTATVIWPFLLTFGGIGQFAAGMWSFHARDTLNSVLHSAWGAFWAALALYYAMIASTNNGGATANGQNYIPDEGTRWGHLQNLAIWQIPLTVITSIAMCAALRRDKLSSLTYALIAAGSALSVIGWFTTTTAIVKIAAYFWLASSLLSFARVFDKLVGESARHDHVLPMYRRNKNPEGFTPGWNPAYKEPGVVQGEW
jgi:succinate-acetate transporter protein